MWFPKTSFKYSKIIKLTFIVSFQFDTYLRSLKIDQNNICLVTDGQQPLRQCLHPESGAKDIHLPSYYWKFNDLRKEYLLNPKSGDLSRSTLPIADVKLPNTPAVSTTQSISLTDILNGKYANWFFTSFHFINKLAEESKFRDIFILCYILSICIASTEIICIYFFKLMVIISVKYKSTCNLDMLLFCVVPFTWKF